MFAVLVDNVCFKNYLGKGGCAANLLCRVCVVVLSRVSAERCEAVRGVCVCVGMCVTYELYSHDFWLWVREYNFENFLGYARLYYI